ncbi:sec-independent translocase [bacterium BMS3Bbin04]|nr:sec-independent translocase [bacterium BMS3Bbin04]
MYPGGGELLLIVFIVLLLFGGKELPRMARMFGQWSSTMRRSLNEVKREFNRIGIEDEVKDAAKALNQNPNVKLKTQDQPDQSTSTSIAEPDDDTGASLPRRQHPDPVKPHRSPSQSIERPMTEKTGEEETPHPDSSDSTDSETSD